MNRIREVIVAIAVAVVFGALAAFGPGTALADSPGGLTCNGSVPSFDGRWDFTVGSSGGWRLGDTHNCNLNKTYALELQYATSDHPLQWHDFGNEIIRTSGDCTNGCSPTYTNTSIGCPASQGVNWSLRWHLWWGDGDRASNPRSAVDACSNGNFFFY